VATMEVSDELKRYLRQCREELALNQDQFDRPGFEVSRASVQNVEQGSVRRVSVRTLINMCVNLGISPEDLAKNGFGGLEQPLRRAIQRRDEYSNSMLRTMERRVRRPGR
jgi:transcriptional regulator with XRE-family HTH domain